VKLAVLGINYYPELIGIAVYNTEMCEYLSDAGHRVMAFTSFPYYPQWKVDKKYRNKFFITENRYRLKIRRSYVYVPLRITTKTRILHELSFVISSFFNLLLSRRPEMIMVVSPPLLLGFSACLISKLKKVPFIFHIQDLQPDAAIALGMIKKSKFIDILYKIEKYIYKKATLVSVISSGMREKVISKGVPKEKVILFPNWVDIDFIKPLPRQNKFRELYKFSNEFIALYAGNVGVKQGLEIILDVASSMKNMKNILFLIVGDGARKQFLVKKAKELGLNNVRFLPSQPKELLPEMLSAADILIITQQGSVVDIVLPSKLLAYMASATPVVASVNSYSEAARVINQAKSGLIVKPESAIEIAQAILQLRDSNKLREELGKNGRSYVSVHFEKSIILARFQDLIYSSAS